MGVNSLPKFDSVVPAIFELRPVCARVQHESDFLRITPVWYSAGELNLLTADRLKMQDWKIVNSSKYSLSCCTCVFRTCIFHPCIFVRTYSVLAYSILRYFRFPYLRFQSPRVINVVCTHEWVCMGLWSLIAIVS